MAVVATWYSKAGTDALLVPGSTSTSGLLALATTLEATTGSNTTKAMVPARVKEAIDARGFYTAASGTTSQAGLLQLATTTEATTGTDTAKAVTAAGVKAAIQAGGGGSSFTRTTASITTASIGNNVNWQSTITLAQGYRLLKIVTSVPARVRVYAGTTYQGADVNRNSNKLPSGDHGLLMEYSTTAAILSAVLSPFVEGATFDGSNNAALTVTNLSGSTGTVTVTFTWIRTE